MRIIYWRGFFSMGCFLLLINICCIAQLDDVTIDSIEITASSLKDQRLTYSTIEQIWDEEDEVQSLATAMTASSRVYIKTNGPAQLATSSIRGASAAQATVLWNGLSIESPMLGLLDWSQLSSAFIDEASLQLGGASDFFGSGAVAGVIDLRSHIDLEKPSGITFGVSQGSFGSQNFKSSVKFNSGQLSLRTKLLYATAINDFSYDLDNGVSREQMQNAFMQKGLLQSLRYDFSPKQYLTAHFWLQDFYKEIPPTISQVLSKASQKDVFYRSLISHSYTHQKIKVDSKLAYFKEEIEYIDSLAGIAAISNFNVLQFNTTLDYKINQDHQLFFAFSDIYTRAFAVEYGNEVNEQRISLTGSYLLSYKNWNIQVGLRKESVDFNSGPLIPSFRTSLKIKSDLLIFASAKRNFRYATLNDRYWIPGGNPNLRPEIGWSYELGFKHNSKFMEGKGNFTWDNTLYYRDIEDWIFWSPQIGQGFWQATNLTNVISKGLESNLGLKYTSKFKYSANLGYSLIRSESQVNSVLPLLVKGTQLYYTPYDIVNASFKIEDERWSLGLSQKYVSSVLGFTETLEPYNIINLKISCKIVRNSFNTNIYLRSQNIFDQRYTVVENRPLPGRMYNVGFLIKY